MPSIMSCTIEHIKSISQLPDFEDDEMRFLCGCVIKKTDKNKNIWHCPTHTEYGEGLRLYSTRLSIMHTMRRSMQGSKIKTYLRENCLVACKNSEGLEHICVFCGKSPGLVYWDNDSCSCVCRECLELVFEEVLG